MEILTKLKSSKQIIYLILGAIVILAVFGGIFISGSSPKKVPVRQGKITEVVIQNDVAKLKINKNGVVEVTTKDRVFYQFWDQERVNKLFALLEKASLTGYNSRLKPGQVGYLVTIVTDGGTITIAIGEDQSLDGGLAELIDLFKEVTDQLPDTGEASPTPSPLIPTPTPTTSSRPSATPSPQVSPRPSPTPTPRPSPTPTPSGGGPSQKLFECQFTGQTAKRQILSETQCDLAE